MQGRGNPGDTFFIQHQAIQHGGGKPLLAARFQIPGILGDQMGRLPLQCSGHGQQHIVFGGGRKTCHGQGCLAGIGGNLRNLSGYGHKTFSLA